MDFIEIGPVPSEEACSQIGITEDALSLCRLECRAYIAALRLKYGVEPEGAELRTKMSPHDFGSYAEVQVRFDPANPAAIEYAERVEHGLNRWEEVGMWAPVLYEGSQSISIIRDESLWLRTDNPGAYQTREQLEAAAATGA